MPELQAKLDAFKKDFEAKVPEQALQTMRRATEELRNSGILDNTIRVGEKLPDFSLQNQDGTLITSEQLLGKGPLVISFFRGSWCPYCNLELNALGEAYSEIKDLGADMVVVSPQIKDFAKKARDENQLEMDVLIDQGNRYAEKLGTAFTLPPYLKELYENFGVDMSKHNGDNSWRLPMPLRAVIDVNGIVRYLDINPDYTQRPDINITIDTLRNLSHR